MEISKNLAVQIVNSACQDFEQLVAQRVALSSKAKKIASRLKIWMKINKITLVLLFLSLICCLTLALLINKVGRQAFTLSMNITLSVVMVNLVPLLVNVYLSGKEKACKQALQIIAAGRLSYIRRIISRALLAHICVNEDDETVEYCFQRLKEIISGFYADNFESSLTKEEIAAIRSWLETSFSARPRAD